MNTRRNYRLTRRRQAQGLKQETLAEAAGIARSTLSEIECGRYLPRVDVAIALAKALDCSVEWLFGQN